MLAKLARRSFYYKNAPGHAFFKEVYLDKRHRKLVPTDWEDPLAPSMAPSHIKDRNEVIPGEKITSDYVIRHPMLPLASTAIGYLTYRCARFATHDPALWDILEFHTGKKLNVMQPRVLYGCYYGFLRTGKGTLVSFSILHQEFVKKAWDKADPKDCYELLEASALCPRRDYDPRPFIIEEISPKLCYFWKKAHFAHTLKCMKTMVDSLYKLNLFKEVSDLWKNMLDVFSKKKHFSTISKWADFYELVLHLQRTGFEEKVGLSLEPVLQVYREVWEKDPNYQWRYNLEKGRLYTATEMVERADQGEKEPTWEQIEKNIIHHLPQWYIDGNKKYEEDVESMMLEYYATVGEFKITTQKGSADDEIDDSKGEEKEEDDDQEVEEEAQEEEQPVPEEEEEEGAAPAPAAPAKEAPAPAKKGKKGKSGGD